MSRTKSSSQSPHRIPSTLKGKGKSSPRHTKPRYGSSGPSRTSGRWEGSSPSHRNGFLSDSQAASQTQIERSPIKQKRKLVRRVTGPGREAPFDDGGNAGPSPTMDAAAPMQPNGAGEAPSLRHRPLVRRFVGAAAMASGNEAHIESSGAAMGAVIDTQVPVSASRASQGPEEPAVVASSETEEEPDTDDGSAPHRSPLAPLQLDLAGMPISAVGGASRAYDTSDMALDSIRERIVVLADARKKELEAYAKLEAEVGQYRDLRAKQKQHVRDVFERLQLAHAILQDAQTSLTSLAADINFN